MARFCFQLQVEPELIGYCETDDPDAALAALRSDPRVAQWEAGSADYFLHLSSDRADVDRPELREVFHLEDQLERIASNRIAGAGDEGNAP